MDMNIHCVLTNCKVGSPYEIDQLASAEYLGRLPHEDRENSEGFGGELHLSAGNFHLVSIPVQLDGPYLINSSTHVMTPRPPQIGTDFRNQKTMSVSQIMDAVYPAFQIRYIVVVGIETAGRNHRHQQNMPKRGICPERIPIRDTVVHQHQRERRRVRDDE
jgi:hypothetical protein